MLVTELAVGSIDRLREPLDWRDCENEPKVVTNRKISRAKELGVVAVVFTAEQVAQRIREMAEVEHALNGDRVDDTVYAGVMRGGMPFAIPFFTHFARLQPQMNPIVDYIDASRYGDSQTGRDELDILRTLSPRTDISGKRFVAVEDTIDEGLTMELLGEAVLDADKAHILGAGVTGPAAEAGIISLTDKRIAPLNGFDSDSIIRGFWIPNAWAGGMGLDGEKEALRWIPEVVITPVQDEKYREGMPEILDLLGDRAVMGMDNITWIDN